MIVQQWDYFAPNGANYSLGHFTLTNAEPSNAVHANDTVSAFAATNVLC